MIITKNNNLGDGCGALGAYAESTSASGITAQPGRMEKRRGPEQKGLGTVNGSCRGHKQTAVGEERSVW